MPTERMELHKAEFRARRRGKEEKLPTSIRSRKKGIPEASEILQDNLAFINALEDQETRLKICEASPKTRDTVVSRALQLKTMAEDEMTNGSRDTKRTDRRP